MRLFPDLTNQIGQGHLRQRALEAVLGLRKHLRCVLSTAPSIYRLCLPAQRINALTTGRIESPETSSSGSGLEECGASPASMVDSWLHSFGNGSPS